MQRLVCPASLVCLSSLVFAGPAVAAPRDGCARSGHGERFRAAAQHVHRAGEVVRTVVVVCDRRTGRRVVVHRAIERRGDTVEIAAAAGRRVAWIERHRGARASIEIVVIELPTRRRLRRLTIAWGTVRGGPGH